MNNTAQDPTPDSNFDNNISRVLTKDPPADYTARNEAMTENASLSDGRQGCDAIFDSQRDNLPIKLNAYAEKFVLHLGKGISLKQCLQRASKNHLESSILTLNHGHTKRFLRSLQK